MYEDLYFLASVCQSLYIISSVFAISTFIFSILGNVFCKSYCTNLQRIDFTGSMIFVYKDKREDSIETSKWLTVFVLIIA